MKSQIALIFRRRYAAPVLAALSLATPACADVVDTSWLGANSSWQNAGQWSTGVVPNNAGGTTYHATIPTGTVTLVASTPVTISIDAFNLAAPATLSMNSNSNLNVAGLAQIDGRATILGTMTVGSLAGTGTIAIGPPLGSGWLRGAGALDIPAGLRIDVTSGTVARLGTATQAFTNHGYIFGGATNFNYWPIIAGSTFSNPGTIEARNGGISFGGNFTRADLGNLVWGTNGTFGIGAGGTLLNQNQTFTVDAAHPWSLVGGTIQGGTINVAAGSALDIPIPFGNGYYGTLDDVVVNGLITHHGAGSLNVSSGTLRGNAEILIGGGAPEGSSRIVSTSPSLTIGSAAYIHGGGNYYETGDASGIGNGTGAIVNHGTIRSENRGAPTPEFDILGTSVFNDGALIVGQFTTIFAAHTSTTPTVLTFGAGGSLQPDGLLQILGQLDLSTTGDSLVLTQPSPSYYQIVKTSAGVIGQFDSVTPGFQVDYRGNEIWVRSVPEPGAVIISAALVSIGLTIRRRRGRHLLSA